MPLFLQPIIMFYLILTVGLMMIVLYAMYFFLLTVFSVFWLNLSQERPDLQMFQQHFFKTTQIARPDLQMGYLRCF